MRYVHVNFAYGFLAFPLYWFSFGTVMWGLFFIGHDCGHGSFSRHYWLNQLFGNLVHTFDLVPYEMWRLSHKHHHKNTSNIDKDEIFYPVRQKDAKDGVLWLSRNIYFGLGLAWVAYLVAGYWPRPVSHLNPVTDLTKSSRGQAWISLICWLAWLGTLIGYAAYNGAWAFLGLYYVVPFYVFASYLVLVTFLHHHEPDVTSWYADKKWTFVLGNMNSVDRSYGVLDYFIHNAGTHQVHHLLTAVPHYNLNEATVHFRKAFPHMIVKSDVPIVKAFKSSFASFAEQQVIGDDVEHFRFTKIVKSKSS